jgi:hypothetical protein
MKTYKVRIKKAPMKMGGIARYDDGGYVPELTPEEEAMMLYGSQPTAGSLEGSVDLGAMDANYPLNLPVTGPRNAMPSKYTGNSVYDFLASQGQHADYGSRKELAKVMGIKNYRGTAAQNLAMLDMLRGNTQNNTAPSSNQRSSSSGLPNGRNQQGKTDTKVDEIPTDYYKAYDENGDLKYLKRGDKAHPRLDKMAGANYYPQWDARHQPWSPKSGLDEADLQIFDNATKLNSKVTKGKTSNTKHSMLNDITNALTGARSYEEYAKKNPYFFNFLGVDNNSSPFVKGLDAIPHHVENALAKLTYDGDPASALEIAALIASKGFKRGKGVNMPQPPKGLPGSPPPRALPGTPPSGGFTMPGRGGVGNYTYGPPKGGFTMPGRGGLANYTYHEFGGEPMEMAYGGQIGWSLNLNSKRPYTNMPDSKQDNLGKTLGPVDADEATYEAERGEVIIGDFDKDGNHETLTFGGKPHSQGGTPAKEEGFIYSKTKKMALGGPIISEFGKKPGKKYTPADLAKQYDLTKYKAVIDDPNADPLAKRTAELMTEAYKKKLGKLAFVQESVKGFPQGVPQIAAETYPELAEKVMGRQEPQGQEMPNEEDEQMARYGGYYQVGGQALPSWFKPWMQSNTFQGKVSPTGKITTYNPNVGNVNYDDYSYWKQANGDKDFNNLEDMQSFVFNNIKTQDPAAYQQMLKEYGMPAAGKLDDGFMGARTAAGLNYRSNVPNAKPLKPQLLPVDLKTPVIIPQTDYSKSTFNNDDLALQEKQDSGFSKNPPKNNLPYNRFDVANLMMAAATPVKSYAPRMFLPDMQEMQGYYDQPDYNAMLSAGNTRAQMNNTFSNAPAAMAANSYNPDLTQGILQETQRARSNNIQTANQLSQANTQIRNQANMMNAQLQQDNYDKWVKTQEETDIANKLKWRKDVMPAAQNMVNNRINMKRLNMMYPEYAQTGPYWDQTQFQRGYGRGDNPNTSGYGNITFEQFLASNPQLKDIYSKADKDDSRIKIHQMYQQYINQRANMFGKSAKNLSSNVNNPYLAQLLGSQGFTGDPSDYE